MALLSVALRPELGSPRKTVIGMRTGYLYLQTHAKQPDLVRLLSSANRPSTAYDSASAVIRYIARFKDIDAATMHFHNEIPRQLVDADSGLYRVTLTAAISAIEASELTHERVWIDPTLTSSELQQLEINTAQRQRRHRRSDRIWKTIGALALLWLLFNALSSMS